MWPVTGGPAAGYLTGAYLIALRMGTAMSGMLFFLTIFVQEVWATAR